MINYYLLKLFKNIVLVMEINECLYLMSAMHIKEDTLMVKILKELRLELSDGYAKKCQEVSYHVSSI